MTIRLYELVGADHARPFSPHCWKTRMSLLHKGLEFETVPVPFTGVAGLLENGGATVPVIEDNGRKIVESFKIALYLDETYPDNPLFGSSEAVALSRFVESWSQSRLHAWITRWSILDIHVMLDPEDQAYFRSSREKRFGIPMEKIAVNRDALRDDLKGIHAPFAILLNHQPFIAGETPRFADYIVFGAFQWLRVCSGLSMIGQDAPVRPWLDRMFALYDGAALKTPEARN